MSITSVAQALDYFENSHDTLFVDVRTPSEFESVHIPGSLNIPMEYVDQHLSDIVTHAGGQLVLVCQSGARAARCHSALQAAGLTDVTVLEGGIAGWQSGGHPVMRGAKRWDMERQVRMVAGSIVAMATLTSLKWPRARFVAGGIGAGLMFAAATNSCMMAKVLAKAPWNRPVAAPSASETIDLLRTARPSVNVRDTSGAAGAHVAAGRKSRSATA